jgi:hypothetical protein
VTPLDGVALTVSAWALFDPKQTLANLGGSRSLAVSRFGGVEKTARFLNVGRERHELRQGRLYAS